MAENKYEEGLAGVPESGSLPNKRIGNAPQARSMVLRLIDDNKERERKWALIKGMFDGNPPFSASKLRNSGQSNRSNFSSLEGKGVLSAAVTPYYDLFASSLYPIEIRTRFGAPSEQDLFSRLISIEFGRFLRNQTFFMPNMWLLMNDFVGFRNGYLAWINQNSWKFRRIPYHNMLVPSATTIDPSELEFFVIRQRLPAHTVYNWIRDNKAASNRGWNVKETMKTLARAASIIGNTDGDEYMEIQRQYNDHDLCTSVTSDYVKLAFIYNVEFSGKWSCHIIDEDSESPEFLFEDVGRYGSYKEIMCPFFFETPDDSWNASGGLGKDLYAMMQAKDRLRCSMVDNQFLRMGVTVRALNAGSLSKGGVIQLGWMNVIPPDFEIQQASILGDVDGAINVDRELSSVIGKNTGIYRPNIEPAKGNPPTATQFQIQVSQATVLSNSAVDRFYLQLDHFYGELVKRIVKSNDKEVVALKENIKRQGVPIEALDNVDVVRALRVQGNGSMLQRQQFFANMMPFFPSLPENGRQSFIQDAISVFGSPEQMERYYPVEDRNKLPTDHENVALLENSAMKVGSPVVVTPTQNHVIHAQTHLKAGIDAVSSLQQGANPIEVLAFLDRAVPHVGQTLQAIAGDPSRKQALDALEEQFGELQKATEKVRDIVEDQMKQQQEQAQAAQQAQAIQSGMDPNTQIKAAETQAKIAMQQQKTDAMLAMKAQKHQQGMAIDDAKTANEILRQQQIAGAKKDQE